MEIKNFTERFNLLVGDNRMEFSKKVGIPYTTVTNIQKGTEPGIKVVMKILKSLPDLSAEWLLRGTEPKLIDLMKEDSEEVARLKAGLSSLCMKYEMLEKMYVEKCMELQTLKDGIKGKQSKEVTYTHEVETGNGNIKTLVTEKVQLPKFKVGDWIINNQGSAFLIAHIDEEYQRYEFEIGGYSKEQMNYENIEFADTHYHLWSIADASSGDVLVDVYGNIGIYEKCDDFDWMSYCSLGHNGGFQHFKIEHENEKTYPATKEQRETLFAKIKEAGYEWDATAKELKIK